MTVSNPGAGQQQGWEVPEFPCAWCGMDEDDGHRGDCPSWTPAPSPAPPALDSGRRDVARVQESIRWRTPQPDHATTVAVLRALADYTLIADAIHYGDGEDPAARVCRLLHRLADGMQS